MQCVSLSFIRGGRIAFVSVKMQKNDLATKCDHLCINLTFSNLLKINDRQGGKEGGGRMVSDEVWAENMYGGSHIFSASVGSYRKTNVHVMHCSISKVYKWAN